MSSTFAEVTVNDVPADLALTDNVPTFVRVAAVSVRNIRLFDVTAVVLIVTVPPLNVPVPADALEPVGIFNLLFAKNASISVKVLVVIVLAIWSPTTMVRALLLSCVRTIVNVSVEIFVTRTTSALALVGLELVGHTTALKGGVGKSTPNPVVTTKEVPLVAGEGAVATRAYAKLS